MSGNFYLGAFALLAGYFVACQIWPWVRCKRCGGAKTLPSPSRKAFRECPACGGTGRRERWAAQLFRGRR